MLRGPVAPFDVVPVTPVDRSSRRTQGGLGIGLTLVRSLVAIHGGRVEARSPGPGGGSEFIVDLPILVGRPVEADRTEPLKPFPPRRILVVDDNGDAAETLGALLAGLGATVSVANSGPAALEILDTFNPDAVLLDIGCRRWTDTRCRAGSGRQPITKA